MWDVIVIDTTHWFSHTCTSRPRLQASLRAGRRRPVRGTGDADRRKRQQRGYVSTDAIEGSTVTTPTKKIGRGSQTSLLASVLFIRAFRGIFVVYIRVHLITSCRRIVNERLCSLVIYVIRGVLSIGGC